MAKKALGKHMGCIGKAEKDVRKALKLYTERELNGLSVYMIIAINGSPRSIIYAEAKEQGLN